MVTGSTHANILVEWKGMKQQEIDEASKIGEK